MSNDINMNIPSVSVDDFVEEMTSRIPDCYKLPPFLACKVSLPGKPLKPHDTMSPNFYNDKHMPPDLRSQSDAPLL